MRACTNPNALFLASGSGSSSIFLTSSSIFSTPGIPTPLFVFYVPFCGSFHHAEHWRMVCLQDLAVTEIHVNTAGETRIKASHRAHDVDALEIVGAVFFEDGRVLDRILIRAGRAVDVAWICIPRSRWIRIVVRNLAVANYDVMRQYPTYCFVKATTNRFIRHFEFRPGLRSSRVQLSHRLLGKIERACGGVSLEVRPCAIAFDRITPLRDLPLKLRFGLHRRLRQIDLHTVSRRLDVTNVDLACECSRPEAGNRTTTGVERQILLVARLILVI